MSDMIIAGKSILTEGTKGKPVKCPFCGKLCMNKDALYGHIETKHESIIPENMTAPEFYYSTVKGKTHGDCIVCRSKTIWNPKTNKYKRFCESHKCKEKYVQQFKDRMIAKHGKTHLLNDPEQQRKMLEGRAISGTYIWSDGAEKKYVGSYEKKFLEFLDIVMGFESDDVLTPAPQTFYYTVPASHKIAGDKTEFFWIPDIYIISINTIVEIKDGGSNPNTRPTMLEVDKIKERYKDDLMKGQKDFNYIKVTDNNFTSFVNYLLLFKELDDVPNSRNSINPIIAIHEAVEPAHNVYKISVDNVDEEIEVANAVYSLVELEDGTTGVSFDSDLKRIFTLVDDEHGIRLDMLQGNKIISPARIFKPKGDMSIMQLDQLLSYYTTCVNDKNFHDSVKDFFPTQASKAMAVVGSFPVDTVNYDYNMDLDANKTFTISDLNLRNDIEHMMYAVTENLSKFDITKLLEKAYSIKTRKSPTTLALVEYHMDKCKELRLDDVSTIKTLDTSFRISEGSGQTIITDNVSYMKL